MSDIDTTPVEYTIRYACDCEYPATGIAEDLSGPESRFADGVLTVPVDCSECLDLQPVAGFAYPWVLDMAFNDDWYNDDEWPEPVAYTAEELADAMVEDGEGPDLSHYEVHE